MEKETKVALIVIICLFVTVVAALYVTNGHDRSCSGCNHCHNTIDYTMEKLREKNNWIAYQVTR